MIGSGLMACTPTKRAEMMLLGIVNLSPQGLSGVKILQP